MRIECEVPPFSKPVQGVVCRRKSSPLLLSSLLASVLYSLCDDDALLRALFWGKPPSPTLSQRKLRFCEHKYRSRARERRPNAGPLSADAARTCAAQKMNNLQIFCEHVRRPFQINGFATSSKVVACSCYLSVFSTFVLFFGAPSYVIYTLVHTFAYLSPSLSMYIHIYLYVFKEYTEI